MNVLIEYFAIKKTALLARGGNLKNCPGDYSLLGGGQHADILNQASPETPDKYI